MSENVNDVTYEVADDPVITDVTGQAIVTKLEAIKNAVQPTNPCLDIDIAIPTSGWSSDSPYTYTYSNAHITSGCAVKVNFLEGSADTVALYLEYEKVTGGVRFTAPVKPTAEVNVRIHVLNADATAVVATTADEVSTSAVSGAANVEDALGSLSDQIGTLSSLTTTAKTSAVAAINEVNANLKNRTFTNLSVYQSRCTVVDGGIVKIGSFVVLNVIIKASETSSNSPTVLTIPSGYRATKKTVLTCMENDVDSFGSHLGTNIVAGTQNDSIFLKSITSGNYYIISGVWIV